MNKMLHRLYSLPLRAHLLLMVLLLALPALALIVLSGLNQKAEALRKGFSEARRTTNSIAREQLSMASNIEQLLTALEQIPELERRDGPATSAILQAILKKNPQYANIIVTDLNGRVWASGLPMSAPVSIAERRSFLQALSTRRFSSGDFGIGKVSKKPTIGFGYPIVDRSGACVGVISANIDFRQFNEASQGFLPKGASFSIMDYQGMVIDRHPDPEKLVGTRLPEHRFLPMKSGKERDTLIAREPDGEKRIVSYRRVTLPGEAEPYLYVRTTFPLESVLDKAQRALLKNVAILSSLLVVAVAAVFMLGNLLFVRRLERLQRAALRFAEGDLTVRAANGTGGEIGRLGEAFDTMARKLTERRERLLESERNLSELNRELARRVEEETERRLSHERLLARHARLVAMGEMIGAIAHQWRQPLATLGAALQSIRMAWERGRLDEEFLKQAEADARKQLVYMSETIEDFRNFFSPDKVPESFDVRDKVHEVIKLATPRHASSGVQLETLDRDPGQGLRVRGLPNEFKQSLLNLVSNAFDAVVAQAESAGTGEAPVGSVQVSLAGRDGTVVIEVRDTGCGIAPEHAERVFDPYFTTKPGGTGTGIGLYMTKLIIEESMGGKIGFTSGPGGTVFRIELAREDGSGEVAHG